MLDIELYLDDIDIDDLVEFEEGDQESVKFIRGFLGRFVKGENGTVLSAEEGVKIIGKVKLREIPLLVETFRSQVDAITADAVNPTGEALSEPPS